LITGKSIAETETLYAEAISGTASTDIENWPHKTKPKASEVLAGYNVHTRVRNKYNDGTFSAPMYSVEPCRLGQVELSKYSISIPTAADGVIADGVLEQDTVVYVSVKDGNQDITTQKDLIFTWTADSGTLTVSADSYSAKLTSMTGDAATITVTVTCGTAEFGTKSCVISKNIKGEIGPGAVWSYLSSSAGNIFNHVTENDKRTTVLCAHLIRDGKEIDPEGKEFNYSWYKE
jgi:hypothetical protein